MTRVLQAGRVEPKSGETRSVVVFLHGYGANGADLLGLADPLGDHLPDTLFVAPDAPEELPGMPGGYQWFPIPWLDGSSEEEAERGMAAAIDDLNAFLDALMVDEDLLPEQVALIGFSQGSMMSLHVAPRREDAIAGVVAFSGRLLTPETLADEVKVRFPVPRATRHEEGCIEYAFWQDIDNPAKFRVHEEWRDLDCLKAHGKSAHMAVYREKLEGMGAFGRDINLFDPGPITKL